MFSYDLQENHHSYHIFCIRFKNSMSDHVFMKKFYISTRFHKISFKLKTLMSSYTLVDFMHLFHKSARLQGFCI